MNINSILVKADNFCDNVPIVVNTVTNLFDIFQKYFILPRLSEKTITRNFYLRHLNSKSFSRCALLAIPVFGRIIVAILDHRKKIPEKNEDAPINALPSDIFMNFFSYLDINNLAKSRLVCKTWNTMADNSVWKAAIYRELAFGAKQWDEKTLGLPNSTCGADFKYLPNSIVENYRKFHSARPDLFARNDLLLLWIDPAMTLQTIQDYLQTPDYNESFPSELLNNSATNEAKWLLVTKKSLNGKTIQKQSQMKRIVTNLAKKTGDNYVIPNVFEGAVFNLASNLIIPERTYQPFLCDASALKKIAILSNYTPMDCTLEDMNDRATVTVTWSLLQLHPLAPLAMLLSGGTWDKQAVETIAVLPLNQP